MVVQIFWPLMIQSSPSRTAVVRSDAKGAFAWERFTLPQSNPWRSRLRPSGVDFLPGGRQAVVSTWDGDVWRVSGIDGDAPTVSWQRIASGLFQPLGLKRRGATRETIHTLRAVYRDLFHGEGFFEDRLEAVAERYAAIPEVVRIVDFIRAGDKRPLCTPGGG